MKQQERDILDKIKSLSAEINQKLTTAMSGLGELMRNSKDKDSNSKQYKEAVKKLKIANKEASKGYSKLSQLYKKLRGGSQ